MKYRIICIVVVCLFMYSVNIVYAAPVPDTGQILQEQKQIEINKIKKLPIQDKQKPQEKNQDNSLTITIKEFQFQDIGNIATEFELQEILKPAIGRIVSFTDLQELVDSITKYLRDKGFFLARAYVPKQDITNGVITISIIAGLAEDVPIVRLSKPHRIKKDVLEKLAQAGVDPKQALNKNKLERSLLLMNDMPGISAKSTIEKGIEPGTTRVFIDAREGPLLNTALSVDNFGNRYTGIVQTTIQTALNNPNGQGDQLGLAHTQATGLLKEKIYYVSPIGDSGLKGGITYTFLSYELQKDLESLDADGTAHAMNVSFNYPYARSRGFSVWHNLNYEYRHLTDRVSNTKTRLRDLHVFNTGISLNGYDKLNGGGITNFNTSATVGILDLGVAVDAVSDASTARTEGGFVKYSYSFSRLQRVIDNWSIFGSLSGQFANQNLDTSEKIILGGPSGVRAYPVGEASGDEGHIFSKELRYDHPRKISGHNVQLLGFFDTGYMVSHNDSWNNAISSATGNNKYWISGFGAGINISRQDIYTLHFTYSNTIGNNPGRTTTEKDADNKNNDNRFWAQFILWF